MLGFSLPSMILMGGIMLASWLVSSRLKANLNTIQSCICRISMSGAEIAERCLRITEFVM
jgi:hypothetical protein